MQLNPSILDQFGDKICIFGFSRGAYTARALAGMLAKVDVLPVSSQPRSLTVSLRLDSSLPTTGNRFRSPTRCILKMTRLGGNKVQLSRGHSPSTLMLSFSAFGGYRCPV